MARPVGWALLLQLALAAAAPSGGPAPQGAASQLMYDVALPDWPGIPAAVAVVAKRPKRKPAGSRRQPTRPESAREQRRPSAPFDGSAYVRPKIRGVRPVVKAVATETGLGFLSGAGILMFLSASTAWG